MVENNELFVSNDSDQYNQIVNWSHQCWQLLNKQIDIREFKKRMNVDLINYKQFMIDYADRLDENPDTDKIYMLRVMHVLYPETYPNPDQE